MRMLITGGTGFVGKNLLREIKTLHKHTIEPIYPQSSKDAPLETDWAMEDMIRIYRPNIVVHLAGRVGGIVDNANNQKEFLETNLLINTNVIRAVDKYKIPCISLSSSCCYPLYLPSQYPLKEDCFHIGNFEQTNYTYALAKACMMKQVELSPNRHICLIPCNLIGKYDHFGKPGAHFVPSMITKLQKAVGEGKEKITLLGNGSSLRQFMDVEDLCELIISLAWSNEERWSDLGRFVNVGPQTNLSIKQASEIIRNKFAPNIQIEFDGNPKYNGIFRKDISDEKLQSHYNRYYDSEFEYTPFGETLDKIKNDFTK